MNTSSRKGCDLWIVNGTSNKLKAIQQNCHQMKSWVFQDIESESQVRFYLECDGSTSKKCSNKIAEAIFQLEGTENIFKLEVCLIKDSIYNLRVDWSSTDTNQYTVYPPPTMSSFGELGQIKNSCFCMLIQEKWDISPPSLAPSLSLGAQWMTYYSDVLGLLTLTEMTLPCSHNAGTHQPVIPLVSNYVRCQSLSLRDQLKLGIRVLDLRVAQVSPGGEFILSHDTWRTRYSLGRALQEVTDFIRETTKEIVILDFHRFSKIGLLSSFDFARLKTLIKSALDGYYLPVDEGEGRSLLELWLGPASGLRRVIVAWNSPESLDKEYMWPGVKHHWYSHANSEDKLYRDVSTTFSNPPLPSLQMWSSCVFRTTDALNTPISNAKHLQPKIDSWFHGCSDWTLKANIISVDFFNECSNIVQASICGNILKARRKLS